MQSFGRFNYYEILELKTSAPQHEISTAYDRAKSTYTGDNPAIYTIFSEGEARQLMAIIEEAYSVLGNKTLRQIYDQRLLGGKSNQEELTYDNILLASKHSLPESKIIDKKPDYQKNQEFETQIENQSDWTGEFLRRVREYKGFSLDRIHEITKINPSYLLAIENETIKSLPAPVFIRGYVVQLSRALMLDEKKVADSYMRLYKEKASKVRLTK